MSLAELALPALGAPAPPCGPGPDSLPAAVGPAVLVPAVRPGDAPGAALARRRRAPLGLQSPAGAWIVARAAAGRPFVGDRADGVSLVTDEGCDVRAGYGTLDDGVRLALLEWLPLAPPELAAAERGWFAGRPDEALALLVRPPTVWSLGEALAAERRFPRSPRFDRERFLVLERHARAGVGRRHLTRFRRAVRRIESQLPFRGLEAATATVAAACAVTADDGRCAEIAATLLARYACSLIVGCAAAHARAASI